MQFLPKRLLLAGAAPLAIAAVYGGSIAFAQSGEPTPTPTTDQADPAPSTPTAPDSTTPDSTAPERAPRGMGGKDCADKDGTGSGSGEGTTGDGVAPEDGRAEDDGAATQIRMRPGRGPQSNSAQ